MLSSFFVESKGGALLSFFPKKFGSPSEPNIDLNDLKLKAPSENPSLLIITQFSSAMISIKPDLIACQSLFFSFEGSPGWASKSNVAPVFVFLYCIISKRSF